jgi:capsid portal protein
MVKIIDEKENIDLQKEMEGVTEIINLGVNKRISIPKSQFNTASSKVLGMYGCIVPPYKQSDVLQYKKLDSTYQACLDIRSNTIVGNGYEIRSDKVVPNSQLMKLIEEPNDNIGETFSSMLKNMFIDLDTFYNGYFEFVKSGGSRALYCVPAKDVFIRPLVRNGKVTRIIDKYVRIEGMLVDEYEPYPSDGITKDGVHYMIHFKRASQDSVFYGSPDNAHLFDLIKQSYLSDQYNINFFSNGGQPSWAILITGGKISKAGHQKIKEFVENNLTGVSNAHKMLYLSVPQEKATIKLVPLSKSIDEQFISLNEKTRLQIALKCRVMPKMLGISSGGNFGGGSAGMADLQLYIETVSRSEQQYINDVLNKFFKLEFGINPEFILNAMDISNEKDDAIIANLYWNMVDDYGNRVLDINEVRTKYLHLKPIDLVHTPKDESVEHENNLSVNENGSPRSNNGALDEGQRDDINNLNPEKNKR